MSVQYQVLTLSYTEIADQSLAAGASITPTVSGIFSAVLGAAQLEADVYCDAGATWLILHATPVTYVEVIVGQANKIRFKNVHGTTAYNIVVGKIG